MSSFLITLFILTLAAAAIATIWACTQKYIIERDAAISDSAKSAFKRAELFGSVKYRFDLLEKLTLAQNDLIANTKTPSSSASHSKHKNQIVGEVKALEEEKRVILKSILDDGFDLSITIVDENGDNKKVTISTLLSNYSIGHQKTDSNNLQKKTNHLSLVKDGANNVTSDSEVH